MNEKISNKKYLKLMLITTFFFGMLLFLMAILDFAALHDIEKDYVSRDILTQLNISLSSDLPDWTSTKGEWFMVSLSLYLRFLFLILYCTLSVYFYRKMYALKKNT